MTTKKLIVIVSLVVISIALLIVVLIAGIGGVIFYQIGHSDAATIAKDFLRNNDRLKQEIGSVKDFGSIVTGNIHVQNATGYANLSLKVIGEKETVNAEVELMYQNGQPWRVTAASYTNQAGQRIELFNPYNGSILHGFAPALTSPGNAASMKIAFGSQSSKSL